MVQARKLSEIAFFDRVMLQPQFFLFILQIFYLRSYQFWQLLITNEPFGYS
jgi:hypothetical protein